MRKGAQQLGVLEDAIALVVPALLKILLKKCATSTPQTSMPCLVSFTSQLQSIKTEKGCQKIDALLEQALKLGDSAENGGSTVVAAVLDGALQVLAGEVARAVNAAVRTIDDGGGCGSNRLRAVHNGSTIAADVMMKMMGGLVASFGVVAAGVQGCVDNGGGALGNFFLLNGNGGSTVVAAVLDGALQVLAGEVARAVNAAVRTIDDGGGSNRLRAVHNGSTIAADVMTVVAAVLDGALQVLAGEVGRSVRAGKDLGAVENRHFCFMECANNI
jgi:hypothetical protein